MNIKNIDWKIIAIGVLGLSLGFGGAFIWRSEFQLQGTAQNVNPEIDAIVADVPPSMEELFPYTIPPRSTLNTALRELDLSSLTIHQIVEAAKPVSNLGRLNAGVRFQLYYSAGPQEELIGIQFRFSPTERLVVQNVNGEWKAEKITEEIETKVVTFAGTVSSSLWESAAQAKMDPNLISDLAEVFAWQVDFSREVRVNDRWRISVEQKYVQGEPVGWGSILAAEYENAGQKYAGILFSINEKEKGYFAPDGTSLRRMFLKSPIRYGRISSRFTMRRFHPILQHNRPHLGVDYAAPIGTPIRAVGDGTIAEAGFRGGAGNMIKIRHNSSYSTAYKHLSGFAKGVRSGSRVQQGQIIGYVGNTGLSTGPHLHFEFFQNGSYVDPLGRKFPSADPVPTQMMTQFQTELTSLMASLPAWESAQLGKSSAVPAQFE
ncbi:peptidoglycan DD-metalloendopeptidase family protein [Bdellovibrio sp. HCB337]|uniref:M23 family metallopeptidase n=1 Tax=Bdellovibrio sp. HCB337 TaxID=3394358 RepID=UPI0039A5F22B